MKESPEHVYEAAPLYMATSPWLNKFNLAVNERLRLFSCSVCMQLYHAKNVAEHLRSAHGVRLDSKVRTALDKVPVLRGSAIAVVSVPRPVEQHPVIDTPITERGRTSALAFR